MFPMYQPFGMMWPNILKLRNDYPEPPTVYSILNSYVNYAKDEPEKIKDLAKTGRAVFFDFDYPLTDKIKKEDFEVMILNRFMMRRIGYETVTAFKLQLNVKLNSIMPIYNKLFDALDGWEIFNDGEKVTRTNTVNRSGTDVNNTTGSVTSTDSSTSDQRYSDTPQNHLSDVANGEYVTDYRKNSDSGSSQSNTTGSSTTNSNGTENVSETMIRTPADKMSLYRSFIESRKSIYDMIFNDLEDLFYKIF